MRSFGGTSRHLVDFLIGEVLDAHDPEMQSLMLRTSVLERLCGPLCDAVLQQRGSDAQLRALARTNLFLVPLDDVGTWFRFHRLFAQLLRVELEHREPGLSVELQARANAWHRANASPMLAGEARTRGSQGRLSQRELTVLRMLRGRLSERRHRPRALPLPQHDPHSHSLHLPQARRQVSAGGGPARERAGPHLSHLGESPEGGLGSPIRPQR